MDILDHITEFNIPEKKRDELPEERRGMISPSRFGDMMVQGRASTKQRRDKLEKRLESGDISQEFYEEELQEIERIEYSAKFGSGAKNYVAKLLSERLSGQVHQTESYKQTEWGDEYESIAAERYEEETGNKCISTGFLEFKEGVWGGSPDRLVEEDNWKSEGPGGVEIKCPYDPANHTKVMMEQLVFQGSPWEIINSYKKDHAYQTFGYMMGTGRKWWDFVTYDPRQDKGLDINIVRLYYDENLAKTILDRIDEINQLLIKALSVTKSKKND
jgi:hypothetical protein